MIAVVIELRGSFNAQREPTDFARHLPILALVLVVFRAAQTELHRFFRSNSTDASWPGRLFLEWLLPRGPLCTCISSNSKGSLSSKRSPEFIFFGHLVQEGLEGVGLLTVTIHPQSLCEGPLASWCKRTANRDLRCSSRSAILAWHLACLEPDHGLSFGSGPKPSPVTNELETPVRAYIHTYILY